jgi:hypothetical protein
MTITFTSLTDAQKLEVADLMQKIESLDGELARIQTERATEEVEWTAEEQEIKTEKNKILQGIRDVRVATVEAKV